MEKIYMDNGSTSFPKAPNLGKVMGRHIDTNGLNIGRGGYASSFYLEQAVVETKERISQFFECGDSRNVIFTSGATMGLNMLLFGLLRPGDNVLSTSLEHNAVARPLFVLSKKGVSWQQIPASPDGTFCLGNLSKMLENMAATGTKPRLLVAAHGSNVSGGVIPLQEIGALCNDLGILFAVDGAQTAGTQSISMKEGFIDALIIPGHKGLLGPQGIGALLVSQKMAAQIAPIIYGGTGSRSDSLEMPDFLPDRLEPGTLNIPGIIGFGHALSYIDSLGIDAIREKKAKIGGRFYEGLSTIPGVTCIGPDMSVPRESVFSIVFSGLDQGAAAFDLEQSYGILTRSGLHCAPLAHQALGTFPQGTVRFSLGYFNTEKQVDTALMAIQRIATGHK